MAFPIIPKRRSGATGNPTSLQLGELATNTATGELFLGGDGGVMLLNPPTSAGTTVTEHTGDGNTVAWTFTGYNGTGDGGYLVSVGGIDQPPSKYSISSTNGGTITFVEAPVAGELISIRAIVAGSGGGGSGDATSLQGVPISATTPTDGQALQYNDATGEWESSSPVLGKIWNNETTYKKGDIVSFEENTGAINIYVSVVNGNFQNQPGNAAWQQVLQLATAPSNDGGLASVGVTVAGWLKVEIAGGGYYKIPYFQ